MDSEKAIESSSLNSPEDIQILRLGPKGILKKSISVVEKNRIKRSSTTNISRMTKVTFSDKVKNMPIWTIFEVEHIRYEDEEDCSKGRSCACLLF
jgi:hypothetical protein